MTVDMDIILLALTSVGAAFLAMAGAIGLMAHASKKSSEAIKENAAALCKANETNISLNDELQEASRDRREWAKQRETLRQSIQELEAKRRAAEEQQNIVISTLQGKLAQTEKSLREERQKVALLTANVQKLEMQIAAYEKLVSEMSDSREKERAEWNTEREQLIARITKLEKSGTGPLGDQQNTDQTKEETEEQERT